MWNDVSIYIAMHNNNPEMEGYIDPQVVQLYAA